MQFFNKDEFETWFGEIIFDDIVLFQAETFDETAIANSVDTVGKKISLAVSLQLAVIGYGNKKFNKVIIEGKDLEIESWFKTNNIEYNFKLNDKLKPGTLTPRRLIRFFRFATQEYLIKNKNVQSYIFKKYCPYKTNEARIVVFPGFEHMAVPGIDNDKIVWLIKTYKNLDGRCKTKVVERICRVLSARGFDYEFITKI